MTVGDADDNDFRASPMLEKVSSPHIVVGVLICSTSTLATIVQLCDGKDDRSGDGGGDHEASDVGW